MSGAKFSNPFPPLELSPADQAELEELARVFVADAMSQYETYHGAHKRQLDPARWKFLRQREDIRVYRERSRRSQRRASMQQQSQHYESDSRTPSSHVGRASLAFEDLPPAERPPMLDNPSELPLMLTVGTIQGDLYDTMYGVVNPTLEMMRIKTSYVQDVVVNAAVLANLLEPTAAEPFRSLSIKWAIKGQPLHIRSVVKNRDMVYLEATGLARLPRSGELVGYQLLHSVSFPQTHVLEGSQRGNMSLCALYRQHRPGHVDVYGRGFLDPTGRIMRALVIKSATDVMISVGRNVQCAQLKKLAYAMRRRHDSIVAFEERTKLRRGKQGGAPVDGRHCGICSKALSPLAALSFGQRAHGAQCRLCLQAVCSHCSIKKRLSSISPDGWLSQQQIPFCLLCLTTVAKASAFDIAVDEILHKDAPLGYGMSLTSSVSSTQPDMSDDSRAASPVSPMRFYHQR